MDNPISSQTRGWIYVIGIVLGSLSGVAAATLAVMGLDAYQPIVTAVAAAVAAVTGSLARANLTEDDWT